MIHVRTEGESTARGYEPADLGAESGSVRVRAETAIASGPKGPFEKAAIAVERDGRLRDALAAALPVPSLAGWSRRKLVILALAAPPMLMLLELDRELLVAGNATAGRLFVDALLASFVALEMTRRTPRMPGVAAAAIAAVAARWALVAARHCGKNVHVAVWASLVLTGAAGALLLARAPSRGRVALELMGKLGVSRSEAFAAKLPPEAPGSLVVATLVAAAGLPGMLVAMNGAGLGLAVQGAVTVAYAVAVPEIVRRMFDPAYREASASDVARTVRPAATAFAIAAGLALTCAVMSGTHAFFDAGTEIARCTQRLDAEARRLLASEAGEIAKSVANARGSTALFILTVAVAPLAEERIYRDLLMRVLTRKYGASYGLFGSAVAFGIAHMGVYEVALYQTVLLGVAFGLAYAEGGVLAAFAVHAGWNLLRLL